MNSGSQHENGPSHRGRVNRTMAVVLGLLACVFFTGFACIDGERFLVTENDHDEDHPAVAPSTHKQEYLVVWEDDTADFISGRMISPFALPGPIMELSNGGTNPNVDEPDVSYNSWTRQYLVVWENIDDKGATSAADLYGVLADKNGPIGDPFVIDDTDCGVENPSLAFSPLSNRWMVVFAHSASDTCTQEDADARGVDGAFVGADGSLEGDVFDVSENETNEKADPDVAYDLRNHQFVTVWRENYELDDHIHVRRSSIFGDPLGSEIVAAGDDVNDARNPSIAYGRGGRLMMVYDNSGPELDATMVRAMRGGTDILGPPVEVSVDAVDPSDPAIAYHSGRLAFVVIWEDEDTTQVDYQDILGRHVRSDGTPLGDVFEVAAGIDDEDLSSAVHHNIECARLIGPCLAVWELGFNPEDLEGRFIE